MFYVAKEEAEDELKWVLSLSFFFCLPPPRKGNSSCKSKSKKSHRHVKKKSVEVAYERKGEFKERVSVHKVQEKVGTTSSPRLRPLFLLKWVREGLVRVNVCVLTCVKVSQRERERER